MDKTISCYTTRYGFYLSLQWLCYTGYIAVTANFCFRGKRTATIGLDGDVTDMCVISLKKSKVTHALLVGLASGEV